METGGKMFAVLGTVDVDCGYDTEELKKQYTIADTVLRNGNTLYICYEVIEAEFEDIP